MLMSFGRLTQMLEMNFEVLQHFFSSLVALLENLKLEDALSLLRSPQLPCTITKIAAQRLTQRGDLLRALDKRLGRRGRTRRGAPSRARARALVRRLTPPRCVARTRETSR